MKISVITVVFNGQSYIERCMQSVFAQTYTEVEYIIIDGNSSDLTRTIIEPYVHKISHFISEPDRGIYDAMNKGIALATGDIIGTLNADDVLAADDVLQQVAAAFTDSAIDAVYGDLRYLNASGEVVRYWKSNQFNRHQFNWGWMPAHPTFYIKREFFKQFGNYSIDLGTAADYELMLRFLFKNRLQAKYIPKVFVNMQLGGASNRNLKARINASINDYRAMRKNGLSFPWLVIFMKPLRKVFQFFHPE